MSSGTAGTITVSGSNTSQLSTQGATTYNTSSTDQTISSGKYLTGTQTIKAVTYSGLSAENIKNGVTVKIGDSADDDRIANILGTYTGGSGGGGIGQYDFYTILDASSGFEPIDTYADIYDAFETYNDIGLEVSGYYSPDAITGSVDTAWWEGDLFSGTSELGTTFDGDIF
ncbi:MAG: hypothetical protein LIR50_06875 [Bacillota bacterium]|nr:hypothetical protein [Bacillota bacterium]